MQASLRENQVKLVLAGLLAYTCPMQEQANRIGVFGGTFDPVHRGHIEASKAAFRTLGLDRLIWVPNHQSPLRMSEKRTPARHRLAMLRLAVGDVENVDVSTIEMNREGPSYLIDTLKSLQSQIPQAAWVFLMGADSLDTFDRWVQVKEIVERAEVWVMPRPGGEAEEKVSKLEARAPHLSGCVQVLEGPHLDISATKIREKATKDDCIEDLVPPAVAAYIREHGLYR